MWISCVHFAELKIPENNCRLIGNVRKGIKKKTYVTNQYLEENNRNCLYIKTEKQVHCSKECTSRNPTRHNPPPASLLANLYLRP